MLNWDSEIEVWSRCVWNLRYELNHQSVVPLAMFSNRNFPELCRYLLFSPISTYSCEIWWAKEEVSRLLISSETGLTASHLAHLALHNSQVITNFRSFLQIWLCLDFGLGLWIFRLVSESHGVGAWNFTSYSKVMSLTKIIWPWLNLHPLIARAFPN